MTEIKLKTTCTAPNGICPYIMIKNTCITELTDKNIPRICPYLQATRIIIPKEIKLWEK